MLAHMSKPPAISPRLRLSDALQFVRQHLLLPVDLTDDVERAIPESRSAGRHRAENETHPAGGSLEVQGRLHLDVRQGRQERPERDSKDLNERLTHLYVRTLLVLSEPC